MMTLKQAKCSLEMQPRTIVAEVRDMDGKLITGANGSTYGDAYRLAKARAFALGYELVD